MKEQVIITSKKTFFNSLAEVFYYKNLFFNLAKRDFLIRYKQTALGLSWVILRPIITMAIFTFLFGRVVGLPSNGLPYPLLVLSGIIPWQFFSDSFIFGSNSFLANTNLITKVYFPRIIIPSSILLCSIIDFLILLFFLIILSIFWYGVFFTWGVLFLPLILIWLIIFSFSASILFSSLVVRYRDFKHVVPFVIQLGMYISPVGFSSSIFSKKWLIILSLNPLVGIINFFRWSVFGLTMCWPGFFISLGMTILFFFVSVLIFKKMEIYFADII